MGATDEHKTAYGAEYVFVTARRVVLSPLLTPYEGFRE